MKTSILSLTFLLFGFLALKAQGTLASETEKVNGKMTRNQKTDFKLLPYTIDENGDTLLTYTVSNVDIIALRKFTNKSEQRKYNTLVKRVKKVYPYAKLAGEKLRAQEAKMTMMDRSERKKHMKKVEDELQAEFGKEIKSLSFQQGRVLLKLIDRETGRSSYKLVDDLRGRFQAWFYDGIAGMFGYDLDTKYEPRKNLEDRYIEEIIRMIDAGQI